jgi:hypothetical protein
MPDKSYELHGITILECEPVGAPLQNDRDAADLINQAFNCRAGLIAIPIERLSEDFFRLKTRIAGEIVQKFVSYRRRLAIVGDISRYESESAAFRDFVIEANRGDQIWFVENLDDLGRRLERSAPESRS